MDPLPRPPYDPDLIDQAIIEDKQPHYDTKYLSALRQDASRESAESIMSLSCGVTHEERTIDGPNGEILVSMFRPSAFSAAKSHPTILFYHPGGMIIGNRFTGLAALAPYFDSCNAVVISPEYRLAPEHPSSIPFEDAYAAFKWVGSNLTGLCIDPDRLIIAGTSGGGAISAGVTLLARERGAPKLCGQLLVAPMLDDRNESLSARQFEDEGGYWASRGNRFAWGCVLGSRSGTDDVKPFEAPGRATDLSGLPSTYLEVGSAEVCRDEVVAYASKLWECGVQAELHVWPGGWHNFASHVPTADVSKKALRTRHQPENQHSAIRLYSSPSDEAEEKKPRVAMVLTEVFGRPLYIAQVPNTFDYSSSEEDDSSEEEEKKSAPPTPRDSSHEDAVATGTSTVPTRPSDA